MNVCIKVFVCLGYNLTISLATKMPKRDSNPFANGRLKQHFYKHTYTCIAQIHTINTHFNNRT